MPRISFVKNKTSLEVDLGSNLMKSLLAGGLPVASSCKGEGVCCKCVIRIIQGMENLSPQNQREQELRERNPIKADGRVSCQTRVMGDVTIDTDYW